MKIKISSKSTNNTAETPTSVGNSIDLRNDDILSTKIGLIKFFIIFSISFLFVYVLLSVINHLDFSIENQIVEGKNLLYSPIFNPEPKEKVLYLSGLAIFSFFFLLLIILFEKFKNIYNIKNIKILYFIIMSFITILILYITYKCFSSMNPLFENPQNSQDKMKSNWDFYFNDTFIYKHLTSYSFILFPIVLYLIFINTKYKKIFYADFLKIIVNILCISIVFYTFIINIFKFPYTFENQYDLNAVYYSVVQVYHGLPLLVDNFTNTYGLYPHFIVPILKLFGLSIFNFTIIMSSLVSLSFLFLFIILKKAINNIWVQLFCFTSIFFNCYIYGKIAIENTFDPYFQMFAIRWILIFSVVLYSYLFLKNKSKKMYVFSLFLFSTGVLWNPEVGILCYLSLVSFYCFLDIRNNNKILKIIFIIIKNLLFSFFVLSIVYFIYYFTTKIIYGTYPDLLKSFASINVFSSLGVGLLPMPTSLHPYILVLLIYLIGLMFSIDNIIKNKINNDSAFIFLLTVLGLFLFVYYLGRSHNWNLFASQPIVFILLGVFADKIYSNKTSLKYLMPFFSIIIYTISFSLFQILGDANKMSNLVFQKSNQKKNEVRNKKIETNIKFIKNFTQPNEKILILSGTHLQSIYHSNSNTSSIFNPGFIELFFKRDYERLIDMLLYNDGIKIFFEPTLFRTNDTKILRLISSCYQVKMDNGNMLLLEKINTSDHATKILPETSDEIIHENLDGNLETKFSYSNGNKGTISLGTNFSVEIILKPTSLKDPMLTKNATVFSMNTEELGLRILQKDTMQNQLIFALPKIGVLCNVLPNKWNYITFIVDGNNISTFSNGKPLGSAHFDRTFQNSDTPLYIGNQNANSNFYFGDIREIKISKNLVNTNTILSTWNQVDKKLNTPGY